MTKKEIESKDGLIRFMTTVSFDGAVRAAMVEGDDVSAFLSDEFEEEIIELLADTDD